MPGNVSNDDLELAIRVVDLKQWAYCPRVFYFQHCLPKVRPITFKMQAGIAAGKTEADREDRRSLRAYGIAKGEREFNVPVQSKRMGLQGEVDMVITVSESREVIPVDFKYARVAGAHFQLQLAVYGMLLEELREVQVARGFLYQIPLRRSQEVRLDTRIRAKALKAVEAMREIAEKETMPSASRNLGKCVACEFRRFCNDVL